MNKIYIENQTYIVQPENTNTHIHANNCQVIVLPNQKFKHVILAFDCLVLVFQNTNTTIQATGTTKVVSYGDSIITAQDYSKVFAYNNTCVFAMHSSNVWLKDNCQAIVSGKSITQACNKTLVKVQYRAKLSVYDECIVTKSMKYSHIDDHRIKKRKTYNKHDIDFLHELFKTSFFNLYLYTPTSIYKNNNKLYINNPNTLENNRRICYQFDNKKTATCAYNLIQKFFNLPETQDLLKYDYKIDFHGYVYK